MRGWVWGAALLGAGFASPASARAEDCGALKGQAFGAARVVEAVPVSPGQAVINPEVPDHNRVTVDVGFCRVRGVIEPVADSRIAFEVWLPPASRWRGRYQGVGNGGFAGSLQYEAMHHAVQGGFAASSTDGGHIDLKGNGSDARWALGHPEKLKDYGWRAIHETALVAKALVRRYYGRPAARSYFVGCSNGGRQALVEAERFPTDYNGIIAGAAGNYQTRLLTFDHSVARITTREQGAWFSPAKLTLLHQAALASCGGGSFIGNPAACHFDPARLLCKSGDGPQCLTSHEVMVASLIYGGLRLPDGRKIYSGFPAGSEMAWDWAPGSRLHVLTEQFFRNMVLGDPGWDYYGMDSVQGLAAVDRFVSPAMDAFDPDLSAFRKAGGKLIQYHGWNDPRVPAGGAIQFYQAVSKTMGGQAGLDPFYRLFMAPGMDHCNAGVGPNAVGGEYGLAAPQRDAEHDIVEALVQWVEKRNAPQRIVATRYRENDPAKGIEAQRPWCAFPHVAKLSGKGDPAKAESYACVPGKKG